ncbi:3-hydroxy-5-phosphonooxypentane-2,4-dione thiolase [Pseudovibrio exalbescens]|uniref:Autoinducer 2 aldolase n=1 Tax=Pseudovibrio exalbescens TaxID=197461 RepID=A0A1U7JG30_9HYPH|nr:3-hydroxy-5-phosphonooxypentane-2,4-dione thiolase [Pseudovibrio exalbescens]OKL43689.1 autoinducer 2 aldolase [Pseudovibrio exalbescens]
MADLDDVREGKDFGLDKPVEVKPFPLRGANALDWGMQDRMARIFQEKSGNTVMLAFDHGYFQGPATGLERLDLTIRPLVPYTDVLMCTRGGLRATMPADSRKPVVLRCSGGMSVLTELSNELVAVDIEDAVRLNASAITTNVYVGAEYEHKSLANLVKLIDTGNRYGVPTMAVTGVGKDMVRDARYFGLSTRICAELGAHIIKTYFVEEGFEKVAAGCPVPIVIAGGKKLPEMDALTMAYKAIDQGASGVDMGRNIFQSDSPVGMIKAVRAVVHDGEKPEKAIEIYKAEKAKELA